MSVDLVEDLAAYGEWLEAQVVEPIRNEVIAVAPFGSDRDASRAAVRRPLRWATAAAAVLALAGTAAVVATRPDDDPIGTSPTAPTRTVTIPDLVGLDLDAAMRRLSEAGLTAFITAADSEAVNASTQIVVEVAPAAGTSIAAGSSLEVLVAAGPPDPLDFAGTQHPLPIWPSMSSSTPAATDGYGLALCSGGTWTKYAAVSSADEPVHTYQGTLCPFMSLNDVRPDATASCSSLTTPVTGSIFARCQRRTDSPDANSAANLIEATASVSEQERMAAYTEPIIDSAAEVFSRAASFDGTANGVRVTRDEYLVSWCFEIELDEGTADGCVGDDLLATGLAYGAFQNGDGDIVVVGIVPDDLAQVTIAGQTLTPSGNTWRTSVPAGTEFEITVSDAEGTTQASTQR